MLRCKPPRKTAKWNPLNQFYEAGKVHIELSGAFLLAMARYYAPTLETVRDNILELRTKMNWSQSYLAAVLGVPIITLRSWEDGKRKPSGAARKLIWLIRRLFIQKEATSHRDVADWGQELGSVRADQIDAMIERMCSQSESQDSTTNKPPSQAPQSQP